MSSSGLCAIPDSCLANDFRFQVSGKSYACNRVLAAFISPNVAKILHSDPMTDVFQLDIDDATGAFSLIVAMAHGMPIPIDESNACFLYCAALNLGNSELLERITDLGLFDNGLSVRNVVDHLIQKAFCRQPHDHELNFLAQHFSEVSRADCAKLTVPIVEQVLANPHFQIESESWLFNWIADRGDEFYHLLSYVRLEYIDGPSMRRFIDLIPVDYINGIVWESLCRRLINGFAPDAASLQPKGPETKSDISDPLNGIIAALNKEAKGNAARAGLVQVAASGSTHGQPDQVIVPNSNDFWSSTLVPDSWIRLDFMRNAVKPTHYTIQTSALGGNMRAWALEGSNDDIAWTSLDQHANSNELGKTKESKVFPCHASGFFRYLRIRCTGRNSAGFHQMSLSGIEFFGEIQAKSK